MINEKEMTSKFPSSVWIFMSISFNFVQNDDEHRVICKYIFWIMGRHQTTYQKC
jgi:hypothetical protein